MTANSSGAEARRTGAPGELTCATTLCHVGFPVNGGGGTLTVSGFPSNYSPGQEVDITVTITEGSRTRYGFQATLIDDNGNEAGTITLTEPLRTVLFPATVGSNLRRYVGHTFSGTTPNGGPNQGRWTFRWRAPQQSVGRIRIFVASNAANDNGEADSGDHIYTTNLSSQPAASVPAIATVSAASFAQNASLAPDSIVAGFGTGLSQNIEVASTNPLPTQLDGTEVVVRDMTSTDRNAGLFFVAPTQINYVIPAGTASGPATISVRRSGSVVAQGNVTIESTAPGIFTANSSGTGVPAAVALRVVGATQTFEPIYTLQNNQPVATPIDLGPAGEDVYLILFGTGVKNASPANVSATIGGTATPILGFAAAPGFVGLDQINVGPIPRSLVMRGNVDVVLTVNGRSANTVTVNIK